MRRGGVDLKEVGIALYLDRKASKCQGGNKCGCLNMLLVVKSSCHLVAVSGQHALSWVLCASAPSQSPLQVLAEKWEVRRMVTSLPATPEWFLLNGTISWW